MVDPRANQKLSGKQKAAILLIALGPEASSHVLKELQDSEIEEITVEIFNTESVSKDYRDQVLEECLELSMAQEFIGTGGFGYAQSMLGRALGMERATEIINRLAAQIRPHHFAFLKDTDPAQLANFIQEEQPQAIALILAHLEPMMASRVLACLTSELQAEVAMRIATMERTPPEVIEGVEDVLRRRLANVITSDYSTAGGVEFLVGMLGNVDRGTERVILDHLDRENAELADEVRKHMFIFDDVAQLDNASLQRVLREVDARDLAAALRGGSEQLKEKIFGNLSSRAADMLREDMAVSGPMRVQQVEEAQQKIVGVVRRLDETGEIVIQRGGGDVLI